MSARHRLLAAALSLQCAIAAAAPSAFDGAWRVTLTCPPHDDADDDARGYTHVLSGQVVDGQLTATHGTQGEPGWNLLQGRIGADGSAMLRLDGVVNDPRYAIKDAPRGRTYSYRVKARFDGDQGVGQRLSGRACNFAFVR